MHATLVRMGSVGSRSQRSGIDSIASESAHQEHLYFPLLIDLPVIVAYDAVIICLVSGVAMRTIVDLPDKQIEALKRMSESVQSSRAELVRRAIDEYLSRHLPAQDDGAFGLWKKHKTDGVTYQERARDEWDK